MEKNYILNQTAKCASTLQWVCLPDGAALSDSVLVAGSMFWWVLL